MNPPTMASRRVWIGKLQRREQEEVQSDILIRPPYRDYVRVIKNKFALVVSIQKGVGKIWSGDIGFNLKSQ